MPPRSFFPAALPPLHQSAVTLQQQTQPPSGRLLSRGKMPTVSSGSDSARYATDGEDSNAWFAEGGTPQWLQISFSAPVTLTGTRTGFYDCFVLHDYTIAVSTNGTSFTTVASRSNIRGDNTPTPLTDTFSPVKARFIRITVTNTTFDTNIPPQCFGSSFSGPALASLSLAPDASPSSQETGFPPAVATFDVYGSSPLPPDQNNPPKECPCGGSQGSAGGPFNTRTGALWTDTTDLTLPTDGPGIAFKRTYLSRTSGQQGPLGYGWTHSYLSRLIGPSDPGGESGRVKIIAPDGQVDRFEISGSTYTALPGIYSTLVQNSGTFTQTLRDESAHVFDAATGRLTHIWDAQGRALNLTYDSGGRLSTVRSALTASRAITLTYTSAGLIDAITDGLRTVEYDYSSGDLVSVTDVMDRATTYSYQNHMLTGITNALGQPLERTEYDQYLPSGKVISQTLQDGRHLAVEYTSSTTIITTTGRDGRADVERHGYSDDGTLTEQSTNGTVRAQLSFDEGFAPGGIVDAEQQRTSTNYTPMGLATESTNTVGQTTRYTYDTLNRPIFITDTLGRQTSMFYDAHGNQTKQIMGITPETPLGFTTVYTYDVAYPGKHWLEAQRGPDGVVTTYSYDLLGQRTEQVVGAGTSLAQTTRYEYDAIGRLVATTAGYGSALQRTDRTEYNADNTVARTIQNEQNGVYNPAVPDEDIVTSYQYDLQGRQVAVTNVLGRTDATRYDADGRVTWTARNLQPAQFDGQGQPVLQSFSPATPDANVATFYGYDGLGRTTLVTETGFLAGSFNTSTLRFSDSTERVTRTEYDELSRPVTVTLNYNPELPIDLLPDVNVRTITRYNKLGNPIWQRDGFGRWTKTDYDFLRRPYKIIQNYENGNATTVDAANASWTDGNDTDLITYLSYTADGQVRYRVENVDDVFGYASTNAFSSTLPITDRVTLYDYDSLGRVITTTVNYASFSTTAAELNRRQVNAYDAAGRLYATRDALGRWASTQYDALGRASGSIQNCRTGGNAAVATGCAAYSASTPDRNVRTEAHYDLLGRVQEVVDPLGVVARTEYDDLGRPVSQIQNYVSGQSSTASRNVTSQTSYNGLGWVTQTTDPAGASASYSHDVLGRVISANDPRSRQRQFGYDSDGTRRWLREPDGRVTVMRTDGLGRVTATINNYQDGLADSNDGTARDLITITGYDRGGRTIQTIDAGGRMTLFGYDLMDRLTSVTENATGGSCAQAPCNVVTRYRYDRAGNRIAITDPNNHVRTFAYDAADQQVQTKDGLGQTTTFQYNAAGLLVSQSDPRGASNTRTFSYDNLDRQTGVSATNLGAIAMSYDGRGQRTGLTDPTGSTSFSYDPLGRVTEVAAPSTGSVGYGYSARGERTQITYPDSSVVDYEYWEDGQLKSVLQGSTALASYTYDTAGRLGSVTRANGTVTSYGYDAADRLTEQATTLSGSNVARFNASYNRRGERTAVTEVFGSASASDTALLKDINSAGGSAISAIVTMGSASYFVANDGVSGAELWRTDGTAAGTTLVKDINSGSDGSSPASLTVVGSLLFFTAYEPSSGSELWVSDGTSAGTTLVKDIRTGSTSTVLLHLTASGNRLFFNADDGTNGQELWVSDGTSAGTTLVKDIRTGSSGAAPESLLAWSGGVLFAANDGTNGRELWVSDGTSAGTTLIKDIRAGSSGSTISGGALAGSLAVFTANDGTNGLELWVSDGTAAGTTLVKDIESGASGSAPSNLRAMGGRVFFSALTSAAGRELWVTDGTAAGTALVKDIWPGSTSSNPSTLTALGGRLLFGATTSAEGGELWVSDGTATGTALVKDISPGSLGSSITGPTVVGGRVFFSASDGSSGIELWASDGTAAGTALVKDIVSGSGSSTPANLTALGERTLFRATDGVSGVELWSAAPGAQTTRSTSYGYDGLGRLTEALELAATSTTYRYTYDLAGNRTGAQTNGSTTSFSYNAANQVIGWSYDAAGNLLNDGTTTYAYDALSRVKQRGSTTYALNGDGVLVAETTGGTTTRYTQDLVAPLSQVLHDGSANYVYGAERLRAMGGAWYLGDMLGSVRATVDNSGATTGLAHYDPWGAPRDSGVAPFGFTGELQHNSTGLVYLRARWYNPYNAAFTGRDPFAGFQEQPYSLHPYQYAYSQPMLITDPSGRCILPIEQPFCSKEKPSPADRLIRDLFKFLNHATTHKIKYLRDLNHNLPCVTITSALAYKTWIDFVKTGGELDVKADYRREYGSTLSLFPDDKKGWTYQMSGNMLYGFIGMFAGFTDVELLDGAGAAQYQDHCREQFNPDAIGPGAPNCQITTYLPRTWDQRSDQAAVKAGIALFNKYYNLFSTPFSQDTEKKRKALKEVLTEFRDLIPEQEK